MSTKKGIHLLCAETDRASLKPILDQLRSKGLRVWDAKDAKKDDIVLAALSESFYADRERSDALLSLIGAGA